MASDGVDRATGLLRKRTGGGRTSASDPMKGYIPTARVQAPSVRSVAKAPPPLDIVDPAQVGPDREENVVVVGTDPANPSR